MLSFVCLEPLKKKHHFFGLSHRGVDPVSGIFQDTPVRIFDMSRFYLLQNDNIYIYIHIYTYICIYVYLYIHIYIYWLAPHPPPFFISFRCLPVRGLVGGIGLCCLLVFVQFTCGYKHLDGDGAPGALGSEQNRWVGEQNANQVVTLGGPGGRYIELVVMVHVIRWMEEILHQLIGGLAIIYRVSTIQGDAGFLPSAVVMGYNIMGYNGVYMEVS